MNKELESLGLTEREIETYIALLRLGSSTVGDIVKQSGVPSSKIYETLDKLISKGLVSFIIKGKTRYFLASEPETLLDLAEEKKNAIKSIIPELNKNKNSSSEEEVTLYEGFEGLKTALRRVLRILKKGDEYLVYISEFENLESDQSKFFYNSFNLQREEAGIITKLLVNKTQEKIIKKEYTGTLKRKDVRFTSFSFPSRLGIFKDHVLIINQGKNISSILIQSRDTYNLYRNYFRGLWASGK
jgi:sugar-specific transcriptional regulator TrmB